MVHLTDTDGVARDNAAGMLLDFIEQMEQNGNDGLGTSHSPEFIKLVYQEDIFNLYFVAERPINDYVKANSASANVYGWAMISKTLYRMEKVWLQSRKISRNPCLDLCFKRPDRSNAKNEVCFLEMDRVDITTPWSNCQGNQFLPRNSDEDVVLSQMPHVSNQDRNLSMTLGGLLIANVLLYFGA